MTYRICRKCGKQVNVSSQLRHEKKYICPRCTGEVQAVEMVPQIPGQTSLDGSEQDAPSALKIIKFA